MYDYRYKLKIRPHFDVFIDRVGDTDHFAATSQRQRKSSYVRSKLNKKVPLVYKWRINSMHQINVKVRVYTQTWKLVTRPRSNSLWLTLNNKRSNEINIVIQQCWKLDLQKWVNVCMFIVNFDDKHTNLKLTKETIKLPLYVLLPHNCL